MSKENYAGAAYNALMEEETKESLVRIVLDGFDALRAAREERDHAQESSRTAWKVVDYWSSTAGVQDLRTKLDAEREARKQAEVGQFNAGIEAAAMASCSRCRSDLPTVYRNGFLMHEYHKNHDYQQCMAQHIRALSKPVPATSQPLSQPVPGSPEHIEECGK